MTLVILLFIAGAILILSEFFIPGVIVGLTGCALVIASIVVGWQRYPTYGVFILTGEIIGIVLIIGIGLFIISRTAVSRGLVMSATQDSAAGYASYAQDPALVGTIATVHTALRPAGSIMIGAKRVDAVSSGTFIDAGKPVRIVRVEGHRVVCEEATADTAGRTAS